MLNAVNVVIEAIKFYDGSYYSPVPRIAGSHPIAPRLYFIPGYEGSATGSKRSISSS